MLRISKLTDYGTVILALLASQPDRQLAAAEVAERTRIALPTVSKVLKTLQRSGLVMSTRGSHGGYQPPQPASGITPRPGPAALGGPLAVTPRSGAGSSCGLESDCRVGHVWQRVNSAIRRALADVTLAQLAGVERSVATTVPLTRITRITRE